MRSRSVRELLTSAGRAARGLRLPATPNSVVPGSELVVTRTAYANNQSKYHLDDKPSQFTEARARGES